MHLRRKDYVHSRKDQIPSVKGAAEQVERILKNNSSAKGVETVFVSTDAPKEEFEEFRSHLDGFNVVKYVPHKDVLEKYKDGGIAIIDQSICSNAR